MSEITIKDSWLRRSWFVLARTTGICILALFYRLKVFGRHNVPKTGSVLVLSNHQSFLDPYFSHSWVWRPFYFIARDSLYKGLLGALLRSFYIVPIRRGFADIAAIKAVVEFLKQGKAVCLYPEGTRTDDGRIRDVRPGFALMSRRTGAPVVPVVIDGMYEAWPRTKKYPGPGRVGVMYGKPISAEHIKKLGDEAFAEELTQLLRTMQGDLRTKLNRKPFDYEWDIVVEKDETIEKKFSHRKLPGWLKRRLGGGEMFNHTQQTLESLGLATICINANCPNKGECWSRGTATVLILGNICTRNCRFCSVGHGKPEPVDADEPRRVAEMAQKMKLKYLVITSVDRDDLADGGAGHFRDVVNTCREKLAELEFELLVPDFRDCQDAAIEILAGAMPFVFGHNVETVPSLYAKARPGGDYKLSLALLRKVKEKYPHIQTKSSLMLGLGETDDQVEAVLADLRQIGCDRIALGQYLRPGKGALEVAEYITPEKFDWWGQKAKQMGFGWVMSSPFTRSSFHAEEKHS